MMNDAHSPVPLLQRKHVSTKLCTFHGNVCIGG